MALGNISINDDNLLWSLQRSILDKSNQAARFSTTFSDKPLQSSIDNAGGHANLITNYGASGLPLSEIDDRAMEVRGELAAIAADERTRFENALRSQ